ncbi:MAG: response regulator [Christensenella sp.]|nr:response regulator [Christensenella sp.]
MKKPFLLLMTENRKEWSALFESLSGKFTPLCVSSERDALAFLQPHGSATVAILADLSVPDMADMAFLKRHVSGEFQHIPVIVLAQNGKSEQAAFACGAREYLQQSTSISILRARISNTVLSGISSEDTENRELIAVNRELENMRIQTQHLINCIPGGIAIYRMSDRFETLYFSDGVAALSGHTREEYEKWIHEDAANAVYEFDRERLQMAAMKALKSGQAIDEMYRIYHKNGSLVWVRLNGLPMEQTPEGTLVYAIFQEVSQQTELYQTVLSEIQTAVYACDTETYEILYFNRKIADFAGAVPSDAIGKKCYEYMFHRDSPCTFCKIKDMNKQSMLEREFTYPKNNHTYRMKGKLFDWNRRTVHVEFIDDITVQKAAEQKSEELLAQLTSLVDNVPGALCLYHFDGKKLMPVTHNQAFYQTLGYSENNSAVVDSKTDYLNVHPEDLGDLQAAIKDALEQTRDLRHAYRLYHDEKKQYIWLRLNARIVEQPDKTKLIYCTYTDITEEKEAEQLAIAAKNRAEQQYQQQMEIIDKIDNTDFIAKGCCNLTQNKIMTYSKSVDLGLKIVGETSFSFTVDQILEHIADPQEREKLHGIFDRELLIESFAQGVTELSAEYPWIMPDGSSEWLSTVCRMLLEPGTNDILCYGYTYNITRQKTTKEMMDTVVRLDYDYLALLDCTTHDYIVYTNQKGSQLPPFHSSEYEKEVEVYAREHLLPEDVERNIHDMSIENIRMQLKDKDSFTSFAAIREEDGTITRKKLQFSYLDRSNEKVLITRVDITDVYEKEQERLRELQSAMELANRANHAKTDFLSRMSHDIRTPLNAVIGLAKLGEDGCSIDEMRAYFGEIGVSGTYLLSIINDVLDMSKIENKALELHPCVVDLPRFIKETIAIVQPTIQKKNIHFEVTQQGITSQYMRFDETCVRQVAVNLLSNAVKFTPEGGHIELRLENISRDGAMARNRMVVQDSGMGISEEFLPKLFTPFEQENNRNDVVRQGTGLGLSIVKSIVELMNGTVRVESKKGKGSAFIIEWDMETVSPEEAAVQPLTVAPHSVNLAGRRILLCEDHPLNTKITRKLLEKLGVEVVHAENGLQAVQKFEESLRGYYDAILMDIRMPVMDGLEATRKIRALPHPNAKTIPIIAMTANAFEEDVQISINAGMNAHLSKPVEPEKLFDVLRNMLL